LVARYNGKFSSLSTEILRGRQTDLSSRGVICPHFPIKFYERFLISAYQWIVQTTKFLFYLSGRGLTQIAYIECLKTRF
jgi:hypothetical protein